MAGLLDWFFHAVDPVLDTVDPMHNKVQTWTTGSKTTDGQSPYFQAIAPLIVDAFLPGVGSAIGAADGASTGNWTKAGLSALGSYAQMGSLGSAAADGANGGLAATEATSGLSSTGGNAAGTVAGSSSATSAFAPAATNDVGYAGMSSISGSPSSAQFMTIPSSEVAAVGGAGGGLSQTAAQSQALSNTGLLAGNSTPAWQKAAMKGGEMYMKNAQDQEKARKEQAMMQEYKSRMAANSGGAGLDPVGRPVASIAQTSPYGQFNGGFNPKRYGRDVRQSYGLLG